MGKPLSAYEAAATEASKRKMKFRLAYGADGPFDVYAVCLDGCQEGGSVRTQILITYPTDRAFEDDTVRRIPWTNEQLTDYLQPTLRMIRRTYLGQWFLEFKNHVAEPTTLDREYGSRREAERSIMAGPDTPGRRWLLTRQVTQDGRGNLAALAQSLKGVPPAKPLRTTASRADLDALQESGRAQIDWSSPDLAPLPREPGMEG